MKEGYITKKPFKSNAKEIEYDVFEIGSIINEAQFTRSLLNIADHVQMKYNNKMREATQTLEKTEFSYPVLPKGKREKNEEGNKINGKPNEMDVFMW